MPVVTIRLDDELHRRLTRRARAAGLSISALLRPAVEDVAWPGGRYIYTAQDELLAIAIQTFALVAEIASDRSAQLAERGVANARLMLRERGLLDAGSDPLEGARPPARPAREDVR
jgi:hypothetical protein